MWLCQLLRQPGGERHVGHGNAELSVLRKARKVRLSGEIFGIRGILAAERERAGVLHSKRAVSDEGENFPDLRVAKPVVLSDCYVGFQLALHAVHCREHCDGRDLAGAPIEVVAGEDVSEKVGFQKFVYRGGEFKERAFHFPSGELGLVVRSEVKAFALGERPGKLPLRVLSAAFLQELHKSPERV